MEKKTREKKNVKLLVAFSLTFSLSVILIILFFTLSETTFYRLSKTSVKYEFFLAAVLLNLAYWFFWAARLKVLSSSVCKNINISLVDSMKIVVANLFLGCITPSTAGGEPIRIYLLKKKGLSSGSATASVLGERLLDAIFILLGVPFAFLIFKDIIDEPWLEKALFIGVFIFILAFILFAYSIKNPDKTKHFLILISQKINKIFKKEDKNKKIVKKINREVENFHKTMIFFLGEGKKTFFKSFILTIVFWSTGFMIPSMILLGLGLKPFFIESYAAQILLIVIIMMPTTPGSAGVTEGGIAVLYAPLIGTTLLGIFVLIFRLITYYMNLIAGALFQYKIFRSVASFSIDMIKKK